MTFSELKNSIAKSEWRFVAVMIAFMAVLVSAPLVYGYLNQTEDLVYSGIQTFAPGDRHVYYSYLEQVKEGHFLFRDLHTHEAEKYNMFNIFWLTLGVLGKILHTPNIITLHLGRLLMILFGLPFLYLFTAYFFREIIRRKTAFIFLLFSSGLGGLLAKSLEPYSYERMGYYHWPMDLWVPESNVFMSFFTTPHFATSLLLVVVVFLLMLLALENNQKKYSIVAGFLALILFNFHPFQVLPVLGVLLVYLVVIFLQARRFLRPYLKHYLLLFFISLPSIIYPLWMLLTDFVTSQRARQNICLTPSWYLTIVSYGFLMVLAMAGAVILIKKRRLWEKRYLFLIVWFFTQFFLIYAPINYQRRMSTGLQAPMVFLTVIALFVLLGWLKKKIPPRWRELFLANWLLGLILFVMLFAFSNLFNWTQDFYNIYNHHYFFYLPREKKETMEWFKNKTSEQAVVLSHYINGNMIPAFSNRAVYAGHKGVETLFFHEKVKLVDWFFHGNGQDAEKLLFLKQNKITHIFYGDLEHNLGSFQPESKPYLKKVFENKEAEIYEVVD